MLLRQKGWNLLEYKVSRSLKCFVLLRDGLSKFIDDDDDDDEFLFFRDYSYLDVAASRATYAQYRQGY